VNISIRFVFRLNSIARSKRTMVSEKPVVTDTNAEEQRVLLANVRSIRKNFIVITLAFILVFTAYNGVINLQSSINNDNNIGLYALAINSAASILACLFVTNFLMFIWGYKWTMVASQIAFLLFILANMYATEWLMYPGILHLDIFN
jgi:hypothetical protein